MIGLYLCAGVELPDGSRESTPLGVPQGGPLSPLLAHIRRHRGQNTEFVIDEQRRNVTGWMNYFGISHTYAAVLELDEWSY